MLVLSRKRNESIRIGEDVTITVIAVKGGGVRIGIDAPQEIPIVRSELIPGVPSADGPAARISPEPGTPEERATFAG